MKRALLFVLIILLSTGVLSCAPDKAESAASLPGGYVGAGTLLSGGQDIPDVNAKTLTVEAIPGEEGTPEETRLMFQFVTGSLISGGTEEAPGCGVPAYTAYVLDNPSRLVVEFSLLAHWDYSHGLALDAPMLLSNFQQSLFGEERVSLYFQLSEAAAVSATENGDTLTLSLLSQPREEIQAHFVTISAYPAYCEGAFSREYPISPTFTADRNNIVLISNPFATQEEAEAFLQDGQKQYPGIPAPQWQIITLSPGELPEYQQELAHLAAYETPCVRVDGVEQALPVLVPDGLYLAQSLDGEFLFSKEIQDEEDVSQQLWLMGADGQARLMAAFEFIAVEQAQFSPDGRKLAVLERAGDKTHFYVFDTDTYELLNDLSEMGFGTNTSAFAWNAMGNTIYAITGTSGLHLSQFDYSIPDETKRHSVVDKNSIDEGGLGLYDGELFFCSASLEEGSKIYRIKPEGGIRKPFHMGGGFSISADSRYMAIIQAQETGSAEQGLMLYDLSTGEERTVTNAFFPYDVIWSSDCKILYYIESRVSGGQTEDDTAGDEDAAPEEEAHEEDPYPYTLWACDIASGESRAVLDLRAPDLFASVNDPDTLYLNWYRTDEPGNAALRACYQLDISALEEGDRLEEEPPA